jgi:ArsR family transcriptional regulator
MAYPKSTPFSRQSPEADFFHVLAHPVRLQILEVLRPGEACVCHLQAVLGLRQAHISQHLMELRRAGLVANRKDGLRVYYSAVDPHLFEVLAAARDYLRGAGVAVPALNPSSSEPRGPCGCPQCRPEKT